MAVYNSRLWGEIGRQRVMAPLAAAVSPYFDLTHPTTHECERQMKSEIELDHYTRDYVPYSFLTVCMFFNVPQIITEQVL